MFFLSSIFSLKFKNTISILYFNFIKIYWIFPLLRKTHIAMVGKEIQPRWTNRCEVRCDYMYEVFHHGSATVIISQVAHYLLQQLL